MAAVKELISITSLFNLFMFRFLGKQAAARRHAATALIAIVTTLFTVTLCDWLQYLSAQHNGSNCHSQVTHRHRPGLPRVQFRLPPAGLDITAELRFGLHINMLMLF